MSTVFYLLPALSTEEKICSLRREFEHLRHHVFVQRMGWERSSDRDGHDPYADYAVAIQNGEIIKGCRLIARGIAGKLPIEHFLDPNQAIDPQGIEVSRLAGQGTKCYGFYGFLLDYLIEQGYSTIYMIIRERLLKMFESKGPQCYQRLVGSPMERNGKKGRELFFPAMISVTGMQKITEFLDCFED